jgi:RNA polymerase sigma-70 factor (ECF subfamily)
MAAVTATVLRRPLASKAANEESGAAKAERRREDARLVQRSLGGEEDAFRALVERYQKQVYWIAFDVLLDAEEARDVAQETFLRVHGALGSFDAKRDFLNWLYRIARNLAIDVHRRRRRRATPMEDLTAVPAPAAEGTEAAGDVRRRVASVLADLPVEYRLTLTLREFHGLTPREIAQVTDCSYPTARWRLHRARNLFRKRWEERYGTPVVDGEPSE